MYNECLNHQINLLFLTEKKIERNRLIKRIREEFQFSNSEGSIFKIISRRLLYNYFSTVTAVEKLITI